MINYLDTDLNNNREEYNMGNTTLDLTFDRTETGILGSILCQKMGHELPKVFQGSQLTGLIDGNELEIIHWLHQIPTKAIEKFNIATAIEEIEYKLNLGLQVKAGTLLTVNITDEQLKELSEDK